ncbi:hypothetical protein OIE13_06175 [Streptosporangium sp. NBC_01810]|nr:hypothetical protein [Streptosporangium sp. NBC_01810]WSA27461.1 hypothetical protein OIE13_06175 [Streptosporangium sp. NBC_01810]
MTHWLTTFDEDGDPSGSICHCEINADHLSSGRPFPEPALTPEENA